MQIGPHILRNNLIVAPMAGVTDRPFRQLCKAMGAGLAISEMISSNSQLWNTAKSRRRADHVGEVDPISVQIAGSDPTAMADAARHNAELGAQIIDINMGCPAKKGLQRCGRIGAAAERAAGWPYSGRRCRGGRHSGDPENSHRLESAEPKRRSGGADCAVRGNQSSVDPR